MDELAGFELFSFIGAIINLIFILVILRRLKRIVDNTRQSAKKPLVNFITEARLYEMTGDKQAALREYYRCYLLMEDVGDTIFYIDQKQISSKMIAAKIEELGGVAATNIYSLKIV